MKVKCLTLNIWLQKILESEGGNPMLSAIQPQSLSPELQAKIDLILESHNNDLTQIVGILLDTQELFEQHIFRRQRRIISHKNCPYRWRAFTKQLHSTTRSAKLLAPSIRFRFATTYAAN